MKPENLQRIKDELKEVAGVTSKLWEEQKLDETKLGKWNRLYTREQSLKTFLSIYAEFEPEENAKTAIEDLAETAKDSAGK